MQNEVTAGLIGFIKHEGRFVSYYIQIVTPIQTITKLIPKPTAEDMASAHNLVIKKVDKLPIETL